MNSSKIFLITEVKLETILHYYADITANNLRYIIEFRQQDFRWHEHMRLGTLAGRWSASRPRARMTERHSNQLELPIQNIKSY